MTMPAATKERITREINVMKMLETGECDDEAFQTLHEHELIHAIEVLRGALKVGWELGDVKMEVRPKDGDGYA